MIQDSVFSRFGTERIIRYAYDLARKEHKSLTSISKGNALNYSMVFWDQIFAEVGKEYPDVETHSYLVDAASMFMVKDPKRYGIIVCSNLFGDILTDLGAAMASGQTWFKVPKAIKVVLIGKKPDYISGKDVILTLIGMIGVDGALYQSLEFFGEGVGELSMADRFTICNMAIEAGGKNGIFPVDDKTREYLKERGVTRPWEAVEADEDAVYARTITIELDKLVPVVAYPHLPENTHPAAEGKTWPSIRW